MTPLPPGLLQVALITTALAASVVGHIVWSVTPPAHRRLALALIAIELPMCALALHGVRSGWERALAGVLSPAAFPWARTFSAPLTEELAKAWPLLLLCLARPREERPPPVAAAMAVGLGFGIGELWTIAFLLAGAPTVQGLAWYQLGGFLGERLMVCFMHGAFTGVLAWGAWRGHPALGLAGAMALHWLGNIPIFLARWLPAEARGVVLNVYLLVFFVAMLGLLAWLHAGAVQALGKMLYGQAQCPDCHTLYDRPLLGLNLGPCRYEPCPHCRRWHLL